MSDQVRKQFSVASLAALNCRVYDPAAKGRYEYLSGGLIWPDEFPPFGSPDWMEIGVDFVNRYLIADRASITIGKERESFRPVWEQVVEFAPNWPGLREDRRGSRAKKRLLAAKRREAKCLDELEHKIQGTNSTQLLD